MRWRTRINEERAMKTRALLIVSLALATLTMPALADNEEEPDESKQERVCLISNRVRYIQSLSDQHVYVTESGNQYYLMTMRKRCPGLRDAQYTRLRSTSGRVCANGLESIVYRSLRFGGKYCEIYMIERVENKASAEAIIADRQQQKEEARK